MSRTVLGILRGADQPDEPCVLKRACEQAQVTFCCESVGSAEEAVRYLSGVGPYGRRDRYPLPSLILLDLDLDEGGGLGVIAWIRRQPRLRYVPVVVLSKAKDQMEMKRAYDRGASSYLFRPASFAGLVELAKLIDRSWLTLNQTPRA